MSEPLKAKAGRLGGLIRAHGADSPEAVAARSDLAENVLAAAIRAELAKAPRLTPEQLERLRSLLSEAA